MLLKDMLSSSALKDLQSLGENKKSNKVKSNIGNKPRRNKGFKNKTKNDDKTRDDNKNKKVKSYEDKYCKEYKEKPIRLRECPYCGREDLEVTGNGYYYCHDCGIKVERR